MQLLGVVLSQTGRLDEGFDLIRRAIALAPKAAGYHGNLGFALANNGRKEEAVAAFGQAVLLEPSNAQSRANLANALRETNRLGEAIAEYQRACTLGPPSVELLNSYGLTLQHAGRYTDAIALFRRAITLRHDVAEYYMNLGTALYFNGERQEAESALRHALQLNPNLHIAWYTLGNVLQELRRLEDAIEVYHRALAIHPNFPEAMHNLGTTYREARRLEEALAQYQATLALGYDSFELRSNLGVTSKDMGALDEALSWFGKALEMRPDPVVESNLVYTLHFHPQADPVSLAHAHARWNQRYAKPLLAQSRAFANDPVRERRLRIGYVSPDFRGHPVAFFLRPLLALHDRSQVEVFCYSDVRIPDTLTARLRSFADVWRETDKLTDEQLAETIRTDRIDVLVDLTMHMSGSRLLMFARKPAPVQVTYLAYCSTTGLEAMDYRLSDPYLDPPGTDESVYSEKTVRLPRTYWCYKSDPAAPAVNALPAESAGYVTFGCLNNYCKVTAPTFDAWFEILRRVPNSRILIHADAGAHRERAKALLAAAGIDPSRLEFAGFVPLSEYLKIYHRIDIALDPFPYTGGTTSCDALWMGVPLVSQAGKTAVSRGGLSILSNLGLPELVARDTAQYVQIATGLAGNLPRLAKLRSELRDRMEKSPLSDPVQFARDVETAYREMWRNWCNSQLTQPLAR
jgi:predicted O-linked N-acetylglucosamine transferase (SPINDLY family)